MNIFENIEIKKKNQKLQSNVIQQQQIFVNITPMQTIHLLLQFVINF